MSLLQSDPPAHDGLLKAALLRRAVADIHRIMRIREDKPALAGLLQRGSIGDDLWNSFLAAEKELEAEVLEVVTEAETFKQGWGNLIFQTANECVQNEKLREGINKVYLQRPDLGAYNILYLQLLLISPYIEVKYGVTKRLFPTVQVTQGPAPAATQTITAKDAAMAAAVQKAVAMGATIPAPVPSGSPAPSQPDSSTPGTPTTPVS